MIDGGIWTQTERLPCLVQCAQPDVFLALNIDGNQIQEVNSPSDQTGHQEVAERRHDVNIGRLGEIRPERTDQRIDPIGLIGLPPY